VTCGRGVSRFAPLALIAVGALTGCVMPDQVARLQKDVADVQQQLSGVAKSQSELQAKLAGLESQVGDGDVVKRSEIADLKVEMDALVRQTTATADKADQVNARVDRLSQDVQAAREASRRPAPLIPQEPPPPSGGAADAAGAAATDQASPPPAVPPQTIPNPNALYTSAYADFSKGNYVLAIQGFQEYAGRFPDAELADNAMYWIGECHFSQGSFKAAIDAFDAMLAKYPKSDKAAAANLKKALAYLQLNQVEQGIEQLRYVVASYPGSDEARIAKDRLASLGKP
jgi:tol-pal system protein YbgF